MNRDVVRLSFIEKQNARHILKNNISDAKHNLAPKNVVKRWSDKQLDKLESAAKKTAEIASDNIPAIGIMALATTLFLLREPIAKFVAPKLSGMKKSNAQKK